MGSTPNALWRRARLTGNALQAAMLSNEQLLLTPNLEGFCVSSIYLLHPLLCNFVALLAT